MNYIKKCIIAVYHFVVGLIPINHQIIVFESNLFRNYTGNPRFIYQELIRTSSNYKCVWVFKNPDAADTFSIPGDPVICRYKTLKFFYYYAAAGVIVSDSRLPLYLASNKKGKYIQTWHGTPLKKLALDMTSLDMAGSTDIEKYHENFRKSSAHWDYLISQNSFSSAIFKRCFAFNQTILEIGYPRNDILINSDSAYIAQLKEKMGLPSDKKIILYAPTWRDNQYYKKGEYKFSGAMDFSALQNALGGEYVIIVKYHYLIKDNIDWSPYKGFVFQYGESEDISTLYLVSDMLITDYSSVMFDYSVLNRPMLFFTYDLEEYKSTLRGFYFDFLDEAPGPVVLDNSSLIEAIKNYNPETWNDKYTAFRRKYNHCDDGMASKKVVSLITDII